MRGRVLHTRVCVQVNIPGEKLSEVCAAAHILGVIGLEHLPVLIIMEPLPIAEEFELRQDINNSNAGPCTNINPFFINNNVMKTANDLGLGIH